MNPDIQWYLSYLVESWIKVFVFCVDDKLDPVDIDQDQLATLITDAQVNPDAWYIDSNGQPYYAYHSHSGWFYPYYMYNHMYNSPRYYTWSYHTSYRPKTVTYVRSNGSRIGMTWKSFRWSSSTFGWRSSGIGRWG
jgi:hypothetical protein